MSYEAGGLALIKAYGFKALCGAILVALLYLALPPLNPDGSFNRREFFYRLGTAIMASTMLGDHVVAIVDGLAPWLHAHEFPGIFYALAGAPAWWLTRLIAKWMHTRQDKDLAQVIHDVKDLA